MVGLRGELYRIPPAAARNTHPGAESPPHYQNIRLQRQAILYEIEIPSLRSDSRYP
jgi:hypothetical protein